MSRMKPKMKHLLLFLPLILVIVIKESYASTDENHATLSKADEITHVRSHVDQSEYPILDTLFDSDRISDPSLDTLPELKDNSPISDDASETSNNNKQSVSEYVEPSTNVDNAILKVVNNSSEISTGSLNNSTLNDAGKTTRKNFHMKNSDDNFAEKTEFDGHPLASQIPSNILSKRILISSAPNVDPEPINLDEVPAGRLDSWRPLWLDQQMSSLDIKPTVKFPSITIPHNSYIESSLQAKPEVLQNYAVSKEPVTAYYFDLSSVIPTLPVGPLYDPSHLINAQTHNTPVAVHPTAHFGNHNFPQGFEDHDYIQPTIADENYFTSERDTDAIEPTPTLPETDESSHLHDQDLSHNITDHESSHLHDQDLSHNIQDHESSHLHDQDLSHNIQDHDLLHTIPDQEDASSMLGADSATITSLYNKTTDELQNSTPAYTLGNSTDFKFTQNEPILLNNSTNFTGVTLPSILSSEKPLDSQNSTDTVEGVEMHDGLHEIFTPEKVDVSDVDFTNHIKDVTNIIPSTTEASTTSTTESTTTTSSTTTTPTTSTSSTTTSTSTTTSPTTTSSTTTSSSTMSTTTSASPFSKFTIPTSSPEGLEYLFPINRSSIFNDTAFKDYASDLNSTEKDISSPIVVVVSKNGGNEPELNLVKMHKNGTNTTHPTPYIKAAVSYDVVEFCQHHENIKTLLKQWVNTHLSNLSKGNAFEIEIFHQPDCENLYLHNGDAFKPQQEENKTMLYFYVKQGGEISPNSTLHFPRNPTSLEISKELDYLKEKILHLELMNASSTEERLFEEAAVGTSIVVIVVVTTLLIILLIGAILAFFVIKRRRAAETMPGRRCTPAANDAYSLDSVSVFYHSLRRKSKKRASNKSLKSYLNQGFDDPNMPSRPLNFAKLTHFISDNEAIYDEFSNIPSVVPKYDEMPKGVEEKNRYANVIPVPETRILLDGSKSTPSTQYINANSIHGPKGELRYYIATQAPLDNTVADFWQMVWEQESKVVVMLTDFVEKGIDKCADYLPPSETLDCHRVYGEFQITLKSRDMREKYIVSLLQIKNLENNLVREVAHMWYTGWPQTGVPNEEKLFISFIFDVRTTRKQLRAKGPIIVHCSPGTGRTGTYIACDLCMRQFDEQKVVDIPKTVFRIRRERAGAVQTKEQYSFIYRVVNLYAAKLTTGNLDSF